MDSSYPPIQITLRCSDRLDEYDIRTLTLRPGSIINIGRASKNTAKPELMIGSGNAYIDSPTISREHAELTATSPPVPCVYITDKGSMHGTMVNGNKLQPEKAHPLSNGDVLQFGANVTRENLFYTARSFTFESSLASYPNGFSVPDEIESSDEEEIEVNESLSCPPRYGTQANPVTLEEAETTRPSSEADDTPSILIDDDELNDDELENDLQDITAPLGATEDTQNRYPSAEIDEQGVYPVMVGTVAPNRYAFADDASSEDEIASRYSSEDDQASLIESCESVADSDESQSERDMELGNDEEEEDHDSVCAPNTSFPFLGEDHDFPDYQSQLMLLEEANKKRIALAQQGHNPSTSGDSHTVTTEHQDHKGSRAEDVGRLHNENGEVNDSTDNQRQLLLLEEANKKRIALAQQGRNPSTSGDSHTVTVEHQDYKGPRGEDVGRLHNNSELNLTEPLAPFASIGASSSANAQNDELPTLFSPSSQPASKVQPSRLSEPEVHMDPFFNSNSMFDAFEVKCFGRMDSAIPPRPIAPRPMQWGVLDYGSPFSPPVNTPSFPAAYSSDILGHYRGPQDSILPCPYTASTQQISPSLEDTWDPPKIAATGSFSGVQTPPAPSSEFSSPPVRRTEVSIREIVEDTVHQPLTPTSVLGGTKRKAEVLDEVLEEAGTTSSPALEADADFKVVSRDVQTADTTAVPNTPIDQRPKKKLRTRIGSAAKSAAAWTLPGVLVGAAASVAFLTSVPNDFFMA